MGLRFVFELSDEDLEYFRELFEERRPGAGVDIRLEEVTEAAERLIEQARSRRAPPFILDKLEQLRPLVAMVTDREWRLPARDVRRVLEALAWFADPADLIPDDLPVLGYLDDAMMVEVVLQGLAPELEAFRDFCIFREAEKKRRLAAGEPSSQVSRADWLDARRRALQVEMRRRRRRIFGRGG
jgi:uncharacterized membrane protein YkvA (DUF1232 family)